MAFISYVLSFVATVLGLIEPFGKKMSTVLAFNFTGNLLVGVSYLLVSETSGAFICFVACVQVVINYILGLKKIKIPTWLILIYVFSFVSINLLTFSYWYDTLALIAALLFVISVVQSEAKYYRILYFLNSTVWIFYDFIAEAYGNLFTHIVLFIATLASIAIRDKNKKAL